jgi:anti-sigma regulatory factor (Ser/Thr protein kinase)
MLEELSHHIMDMAMNSIRAGSKEIQISLVADKESGILTLSIDDKGAGMTDEQAKAIIDSFSTTKTGTKVGLGVPLLKGATDMCGGQFSVRSAPGEGTKIVATFLLDHPDLPPIGNINDTFFLLCVTNPDVRFVLRYKVNGKDFRLDTDEINARLKGVPINHPRVIEFLKRYLSERL